MRFSIREATQEDYEQLCEVIEEIDAYHREALPHVFQEHDGPPRTKGYISDIIADGNNALFVAETESQIIGIVHISAQASPDIPIMVSRRYARIDLLVVRRGFQRSGVARALTERAHTWALDRRMSQVELTVWEFNQSAIAFYENMGYETAKRVMWKSLK